MSAARKRKNSVYACLAGLPFVAMALHAAESEPPLSEADFWGDVPVVMSASRMSQPLVDVPVAMTVIDRDMIAASGARQLPELFRLVPGFIVGYHDGHTPSVSYHMSLDLYSRRMQVLIDGRSVYTTAVGGVPWSNLGITLDDIERIEVVRGPNSVSYGANSFQGVINIITKPAVLDRGGAVRGVVGDEGVKDLYLRHGGESGRLDYRVSAGFSSDGGLPERLDYQRTRTLSLRGDYHATASDLITFHGGVGQGPRGVENPLADQQLDPSREKVELNHYQHLTWERQLDGGQSLALQFYHILERSTESYTVSDYVVKTQGPLNLVLDPMFIDFDLRTERTNLELQHTLSLFDSLRFVWGGGVRQDSVWGAENLMGNREIGNHLNYGFINGEWEPDRHWLVNMGAMAENYSTTGTAISPRAAINYRFTPAAAIRFSISRAIRTPSMFEYAASYTQRATTHFELNGVPVNVGPAPTIYNASWLGTRSTRPERIRSYELGYTALADGGRLSYDAKLFREEVADLIVLVDHAAAGDNYDGKAGYFENHDALTIRGAELETTRHFDGGASARLSYAYVDVENEGVGYKTDYSHVAPEHSASLLLMKNFGRGYKGSLGYYFTGRIAGWEGAELRDAVRRLDLRLAKTANVFERDAEVVLALRNVLGRYEEMEVMRPVTKYPYLNEVDPSAYLSVRVQFQ